MARHPAHLTPRTTGSYAALRAIGSYAALVVLVACRAPAHRAIDGEAGTPQRSEVRIAYQRSSWSFLALRSKHVLEKRLGPSVDVRWIEMTAGAPIMEAINLGGADLGAVGDTPAVFARAAGYAFEYVALEPAKPDAIAVVVPGGSRRRAVADLKGASVAVQKGSTAHHLLVRALAAAGLTPDDVHEVFLPPPDALAAFASGHVDAWAVWDPYFAQAELSLGARPIVTAKGLLPYYTFYVARPGFAHDHGAEIDAILREVADVDRALDEDPARAANALAAETGVEAAALARSLARMHFGVEPMSPEVLASQDALASLFDSLHLLPGRAAPGAR